MDKVKETLKIFYKLYIAQIVCKFKGHKWKRIYLLEHENAHRKYRTHCQRCTATSFDIEVNKKN